MTDASPMDSAAKQPVGVFAAGCAAALAATAAVALSAPSLMRPLIPAVLFNMVMPFFLGVVFCWILGKLRGLIASPDAEPRIPAVLGALIGALPWLMIAGTPIAKATYMMWVGVIMAVVLGCAFRRANPLIALAALVVSGGIHLVEPDRSIVQEEVDGMSPLIVLGLDSATWDQIDPMIAAGELPNMKRLLEVGARGQLESEDPTLSARIWTIIATGRTAEDNGILDFERDRRDLKTGRVWDAVKEADGKVGLTGWLMTWPPDKYPGFCMPGWVAPGEHTHPMDLAFLKPLIKVGRQDLSIFSFAAFRAGFTGLAISSADHVWENLGHFWKVVTATGKGKEKREKTFWRMQLVFANLSSDAWFDQMVEYSPAFGALLITPIDTLGHHYWAYHEPEGFPNLSDEAKQLFKDVLREGYRKSDEVLGRMLDRTDFDKTTFMIFSDHGMQALESGVRRTVRPSPKAFIEFVGLDPVELGIRAAVAGNQLILTCDKADAEQRWEILEDLRKAMLEVRVDENPEGRPFQFEPFPKGQTTLVMDFYAGQLGSEENHLLYDGNRQPLRDMFYEELRTGVHHRRGIMVVAGPGVKKGGTFEGADIYDCTPSMLYGLGLPVPDGLPGKVMTDAWEDTYVQANPVQTVAGFLPDPPAPEQLEKDEDEVKRLLEDSGYIETTDDGK